MARTPIYLLRRINFSGEIIIRNPNQSYTCGRGKDNQFICPSMLVSRRHCIFIVHADGLYIRDLKSSNGVYVNGKKQLTDTKLNPGDIIGIGNPDINPLNAEAFAYSLEIMISNEEFERYLEAVVVPNIKVEKDDDVVVPHPETAKPGYVIKRSGELDDSIPPKKLMKLEANDSSSNSIGHSLERTTVADQVSNSNSTADLGPSTRSTANLVPNSKSVAEPIPSTSSAPIPPIDLFSIKNDPDNDDIQILGYYSLVGNDFSELINENSFATHCKENSKTNKPEAQSAEVLSKALERSADKTIIGEHESKNKPCKIKITSILSIQPYSSLDISLQNIRGNNLTKKNPSEISQVETNCGKSCDPKNFLNINFKKAPESTQSDPKPDPKLPNTFDNLSGPVIKKANKENVQFLSNGHISSIDNMKIKEKPSEVNNGSIRIRELSSLKNPNAKTNGGLESKQNGSASHVTTYGDSKHCDQPVTKESSNKVGKSKKIKQPGETNYDSDDELFVVAEVNNSERSQYLDHLMKPTSISSPIKLKPVKKESTAMSTYSEVDIVCLSSDDEYDCVFPCSQLFDSVEMKPVIKQEPIEEGEMSQMSQTCEEEDVIFLSDSDDDENNPWFHRLYNSQVYKPSQDFCVKTEVQKEVEQTNEVDEFGLAEKKPKLVTSWKDHLPETEEERDDDVWDENIQSQETAAEEAKFSKKQTSQKIVVEAKKSIPKSIVEKSIKSTQLTRSISDRETDQPTRKKIRKMDVVFTEKKDLFLDDISPEEEVVSLKSAGLNSSNNIKDLCTRTQSSKDERRKCGLEETIKDLEKSRDSIKLHEGEREQRRNYKYVREIKELKLRESRSGSVINKETREGRRGSDETREIQKVYVDQRKRQASSIDRERRSSSPNNQVWRRHSNETREPKQDKDNQGRRNEEFIREKKQDDSQSRKRRTDQVDSRERNKENQVKQEKIKQMEENQNRKEFEKNQRRKSGEKQERGKDLDRKKSSEFERKKVSEIKTSEDDSHRMNISNGDLQNTETIRENYKKCFELPKTKNFEVEMQKLDKTFGNVTQQPKHVILKLKESRTSIPTEISKTGQIDQNISKTLGEFPRVFKPSEVGPKKLRCFERELQSIDEEFLVRKNQKPPRKIQLIEATHMPKRRGQSSSALTNNDYPNESRKILPPEKTHQKNRRSRTDQHHSSYIPRDEKERIASERKEKLKQVELHKKLNAEVNPVPSVDRNRAPAKAKVTYNTRQDNLINEHLKTASLKPGIAHQRKSNAKPIAHCSKLIPEVENTQRDNVRSSSMEEVSEKKDEFHLQVELRNPHVEEEQVIENKQNSKDFTSSKYEPVSPEECMEFDEIDNTKAHDLIVKYATNETDYRNQAGGSTTRRSCLASISFHSSNKKKKRVQFNDELNTTRIYTIEDNHSLQRVVGKDAPINRKKPPCQYKLDEYLTRIFEWNPRWLEEQKTLSHEPPVYRGDLLRPMKNRYNSFEEYCNFLRPLLLLEIWNALTKESECEEKKYKFRSIFFSVVRNSIKKLENQSQISFSMEFLLSEEDFKKDQYPGIGHLIIFEYNNFIGENDSNGHGKKKSYHWQFGYVTNRKHVAIRPGIHFNKELNNFVPNAKILLTLTVLTKKDVKIPTDQIFRMRGAMYLKSNMREIQALQYLPCSQLNPLILNPLIEDYQLPKMCERNSLATNDALNEKQIEAVMRISEAALSDKPKISLIHGPPGTGKSKVIVNIVAQILLKGPDTKILVCAPSNAAIDEIVIRLLDVRQTLKLKPLKMVRVGRLETMNHKVKNVSLTELGRKQVEKEHKVPEKYERIENEETIRKYERIINDIEEKMKCLREQRSINELIQKRQAFQKRCQELRNRNNPTDLKELNSAELNKRYRVTEEVVLSKATVIACTLSSCYSGMMEKLFGQKGQQKIQICIVDEATQSCETESLIPLMLGVEKMILVGDTNQLPATILSKTAKEMGLDQSLFSRLEKTFAEQIENPIIMLDTQYRMDYPISSWPNSYFYQGKLKDKAIIQYVPYCSYRVLNLNSTQDESKFSNAYEADFVAKIVYIMMTTADFKTFKNPLQIGVITPYQSQRNVIYSRIERRLDSVSTEKKSKVVIEVNTVDSFQGQERDVIIMSCVRTNGIGFMSDKQRLCVALTRAKSSLILCGNFKTFEKDEMWSELLIDAKRRDIYIDVEANISLEGIQNYILRQ